MIGMAVIVRLGHDAAFQFIFPPTLQKSASADQTTEEHLIDPGLIPAQRHGKESFMGSTADKVKGTTNEAIGKAKQGVGEAVGSDQLQGEGAIQQIKGKGQKAVGDAKEATKDALNKAAAAANKNL
jgi:uncharacterized protein YjbJ (UPF0337 family)